MAKTYEQKLAEKRVKADAKKAEKMWNELNIGIDRIIIDMGYERTNSLYTFKKVFYGGMQVFELTLDVFDLLVSGNADAKIKAIAKERKF